MTATVQKRLPDWEFKKLWRARVYSPEWTEKFAPAAREHFKWKCCQCGKRGWIVDHKYYWKNGKLIFGHETYDDVRLLCGDCNVKGVRSDAQVQRDAKDGQWEGWINTLSGLAWIADRKSVV